MAKAKIRKDTTDISLQHGNSWLLKIKAKKTPDDEYYTLYEHVDAILRPCIEKHALDGKRVYCNCDTKRATSTNGSKTTLMSLALVCSLPQATI